MSLIRITRRWGATLYETEAENLRAAVVKAVASGADLSGVNLSGTNLSMADLSGAHLSKAHLSMADLFRADLSGADLSMADLSGAHLSGAHLSKADLSMADLSGADLSRAHLSGAHLPGVNLFGTDLSRADLSGTNLSMADLCGADLFRANGVDAAHCTPLLMLLDQPGPIRAFKLVTQNGIGPFHGGLLYRLHESYAVPDANTDVTQACGRGINLATLDWCLREWREGYRVLIAEFTAADIAAIPTATDGKIRVHRCKIVGEKDVSALVSPSAPVPVTV